MNIVAEKPRKPAVRVSTLSGETVSPQSPAPKAAPTLKASPAPKKATPKRSLLPTVDPTAGDTEIPKDKTGKFTAKGLPCLFSGEQTVTPKAKFISGNDAKLKSIMLKVLKKEATMEDIPALARRWMAVAGPLVGFQIVKGKLVQLEQDDEGDEE